MSTPTTRKVPQLRHRRLTILLAALTLLFTAGLGSAINARPASAQIYGGYGGFGGYGYGGFGGYGYGGFGGYGYGGFGGYGYGGFGGYGYPGSGFVLNNGIGYLNPSYSSCTNTVYCGSGYPLVFVRLAVSRLRLRLAVQFLLWR